MSVARVQRAPVRANFTKALDALRQELDKEKCDSQEVEKLFKRLQSRREKLQELDQMVEDEIRMDPDFTEDIFKTESDVVNQYADQFTDVEIIVAAKMRPREEYETASNGAESGAGGGGGTKSKYRLPKLELKKFSGDAKQWLGFWSQFQSIHDDDGIPEHEKFQYLLQSTTEKSVAREVVESFPPTAENYPKVVDYLKSRFGDEDVLREVYVRDLLQLVMKRGEKTSISKLYDQLETQLRALESLQVTRENNVAVLYPMVESALSEETLRAWQRSSKRRETDGNRLTRLMDFLKTEVESEARINLAQKGFGEKKETNQRIPKPQKEKYTPTATDLVNQEDYGKKTSCIFCSKGGHSSSECFMARNMTLEQKNSSIRERRACYYCLQRGHSAKFCRIKPRCHICEKPHFVLMCPLTPKNQNGGGGGNSGTVNSNESSGGHSSSNARGGGGETNLSNYNSSGVLLQTLEVKIIGEKTNVNMRALIDTGSQHSYVSQKAAEVVGVKSTGVQRMTHILFGGQQTREKTHRRFHLKMKKMDSSYTKSIEVLEQEKICGPVSSVPNGPWLKELQSEGIILSDVGTEGREIHLLFGADVAGELFTGRMHHTASGPIAMETVFGWTLMGKMEDSPVVIGNAMLATSLHTSAFDIQDLWRMDILGITDPVGTKTKEELTAEAQEHFNKTVRINEEGRYEVTLPWIEGHPPVSQNREMAESRLKAAYRKLEQKGKVQEYQKILDEWKSLGVIERVEESEPIGKSYLPHRPVFKPSSLTTPTRPVFNASAKTGDLPSLNDCLEKGPNLIELLPDIFIRFRMKRYGILSDIKKAFLMISLRKEDRDFLRFLWWENGKLVEYRHCRVVFGISSSPFLLAATLNHHLDKYKETDGEMVEILRRSLYVDNSLSSFDREEELKEFMEISTRIIGEAKMELRGWEWSRSAVSLKSEGAKVVVPVLGMLWDTEVDSVHLDLSGWKEEEEEKVEKTREETSKAGSLISRECRLDVKRAEEEVKVTKRQILSAAQKVFDLVGATCPVTLVPKLQLQELWKHKFGWDEALPSEVSHKFMIWKKELRKLQEVDIPRWISASDDRRRSIHTFTDASKYAYSACVFLRTEGLSSVRVQLVMAKARVAPTKQMTIPRLELMGCCIGTRLTDTVKKAMGDESIPTTYWTDSCNALFWIQRTENWATFVWNRVQEIRRLSRQEEWRHVAGENNPADLPSRGCSAQHLVESRWWEGPAWLYLPEEEWPQSSVQVDMDTILKEKKKTAVSQVVTEEARWYLRKFSSYRKLVRMIGWMLRWRKKRSGCLSQEEESEAELYLLRIVQEESFSKDDRIIKQLHAVKDDFGLWRVQTKIIRLEDFEDFRFPILLPSDHPVVSMMLIDEHKKHSHCGTQVLLCSIRERFWIPKSRRVVSSVIKKCGSCMRQQVKPLTAVEAPLPLDRIRDAAVFEVTGVDLGGPLYLKDKDKVWFVVFTCAVYRVVHLEVVSTLSTEGFIMALRRFIARRGRPDTIYSDNGTNFTGTNNLMKKLDWKAIAEDTAVRRIKWVFNPPSSPWWGGWWERIVGMVKGQLRKILGRASLNYEELETVLCDVEEVCNSRPLTYVSEDPEDLLQLTPAMFLMDLKTSGVADLDKIDETSLNRRIKYRQQLRRYLRERFRSEYLAMLVHHHHLKKTRQVGVGEIVLIGDDNRKRLEWKMAKVLELYPGGDGVERVARVKTTSGEVIRPVQRLYPLEMVKKIELEDEAVEEKEIKCGAEKSTRSGRRVKMPTHLKDYCLTSSAVEGQRWEK